MKGNLQEVSLGGSVSTATMPSTLTTPSQQLDKGEESPLLTHCTGPLPDLLEALQEEQQQQQQQQQQSPEFVPDDASSVDLYPSDDEYHSPLEEDEIGNENSNFTRSACNVNVNMNFTQNHTNTNSMAMRQNQNHRARTPADQMEHPLRLQVSQGYPCNEHPYNSNKEQFLDPSILGQGLEHDDHPLRNTNTAMHTSTGSLMTAPSPPASIRSNPTVDGSTTSSSTLQQQQQHSNANVNTNANTNRRRQRQRSLPPSISSTSTSSAGTTLRRTRAGSSSNNRMAQHHERQQQQGHHHERQDLHTPQDSSASSSSLGLRASLDSGMAAIRRWIRTKPNPNHSSQSLQQQQQQQQSRSSRTVSWHSDMDLLSTTNSVGATSASLGDEDLFALAMNGDDPRSPGQQLYHPTIFEETDEDDEEVGRQRSLSEPDALSLRNFLFQRAVGANSRRSMRRRRTSGNRGRAESEGTRDVTSMMNQGRAPHLSSSAAAALYSPSIARLPEDPVDFMSLRSPGSVPVTSTRELSTTDGGGGGGGGGVESIITAPENSMAGTNTADPSRLGTPADPVEAEEEIDPERQARIRWIRINRRFQLVITLVALLFSLLLFAILICWVVLTSAYVVSFDKGCDVPLKPYFWLVTLQLVLDVFRSDIMRFIFHWDPSSNQRIPCRVIAYNVAYLLYALLVLRLGIRSVFIDDTTCHRTAPELFNSSAAFVSLSIAAWTTILCGYLLPFCVVAALLTYNGYNPSAHINQDDHGASQAVFPAAYSTTGAPPGCVDQLRLLRMEDFPDDYPRECCICMEEFNQQNVVVETACKHVFHKQCCREWLRTARTCPVCRTDIPGTLEDLPEESEARPPRIPIGPTGRPVAGLLRILRHSESNSSPRNATQRVPESSTSVSVHPNVP
jgi:hypothetical protein